VPVTFTIDHERRLVQARAEGEIGVKDIEALLDAIVVENALPYRKLFDGRKAIAKYTDDLQLVAARIRLYSNIERRGPLALVTAPDQRELADRFVELRKGDSPARVFLEEDEALRWLEGQPD